MTHVLRARRLLTEEGWLDDHQLRIADGVIAAIEPIPVGVTEPMRNCSVPLTSTPMYTVVRALM